MQQIEMQLTSFLKSLGCYKYTIELKNQVMQFINSYPHFTMSMTQVQRQSGTFANLIALDGMVQTLFQGISYNTLIRIVLDTNFPVEGGIHIFVITNLEKSHFRPIKNLDIPNNYYNVEGMQGYNPKLPLYEVIRMVSMEFSRDPPVSAGGRGQTVPRIYMIPNKTIPTATNNNNVSSSYGGQMYSSAYPQPSCPQPNPYEMPGLYGSQSGSSAVTAPASSNYYPSSVGYQASLSAVQQSNSQGNSIAELRSKLMAVLSNEYERRKAELMSELDNKKLEIKSLNDDCERKKAEHTEIKNKIESVGKEKETLEKRKIDLSKEIENYENQGEPDPDTVCDPVTEWEKQLLECIAKDNAYEDLIYSLNKAYEKKKLDLEQFFVSVREEAKHQFEQKALANKIRGEMKKIGYRPPY